MKATGYRVLSLILVALTAVFVVVAMRSVHFEAPSPYDPPDQYSGEVITWHSGSADLFGWASTNSAIDCPSVVAWMTVDGQSAYVGVGPVSARAQHVLWMGTLRDVHGHPVAVTTKPSASFLCYR